MVVVCSLFLLAERSSRLPNKNTGEVPPPLPRLLRAHRFTLLCVPCTCRDLVRGRGSVGRNGNSSMDFPSDRNTTNERPYARREHSQFNSQLCPCPSRCVSSDRCRVRSRPEPQTQQQQQQQKQKQPEQQLRVGAGEGYVPSLTTPIRAGLTGFLKRLGSTSASSSASQGEVRAPERRQSTLPGSSQEMPLAVRVAYTCCQENSSR